MQALKAGPYLLPIDRSLVMGVVNVTPDSFSDGGHFLDPAAAIAQARRLVDEGADLLDIGGESSRPGAEPVPLEEELRRVLPVLRACVAMGKPVSVDTYKPEVMQAAAQNGAAMLNDIWGFRRPGAFEAACAAAREGLALCIMHMQRDPQNMQREPSYGNVVTEVGEFLRERVAAFQVAGVAAAQLVIDPGFGFGKTVQHNLQLLHGLQKIAASGVPVLAGLSRKSTIGALTGRGPGERLAGSVAAALIAAQNGATILRVHDVAATRDALAVWDAVRHVA
ncbi:MAG TPA: dihydropteroate synthase [Burkholderiales bacterium]|jgi:dihydropteroate synthase|nr:dihydropteroate synthase [Burkholderiales bacterium]